MNNLPHLGRAQWSSPINYILVMVGAIVGMGNVLQFPFLVFQYGGLFIILFLLCEIVIAIPLLLAELSIGRRGKQNPVGSFEILSLESGRSIQWRWIGWVCFIVSFLTLLYYGVSAGFPINYLLKSLALTYSQSIQPVTSQILESHLSMHFFELEACFILFIVIVMLVINRGINRGLETISKITVPLYFFLLFTLAIYTSITGNFTDSLRHLFQTSNQASLMTVFFAAMSFAFFKLGVGMGTMIVYGSYLPHSVRIGRSTLIIVAIDALISLLAYFILFPLIFSLNPGTLGEKLTNYNIILIFTGIPHGLLVASLFFFAVILTAWTPMIAMTETVVVTLIERFNLSRRSATAIISLLILLLGSIEVSFHTTLIDEKLFGGIEFYTLIKSLTTNVFTPFSALLTALFAGWLIKKSISYQELKFKPALYNSWLASIRYLAPLVIIILFIRMLWLSAFQ